ncbi:MAG: YfhO family protein [Chloroflexota bacterium]
MTAHVSQQFKSSSGTRLAGIARAVRRRPDVLGLGLLLVLSFLFMSPGLPPWRVAAPMEQLLIFPPWHADFPNIDPRLGGSDILFQQLPWQNWMQHELAAGRFPLWVSGPLGGYPLFAYYQTGVLYPLHWLLALMPISAGFGIILALKVWIAGAGMWFFLRALGLRPGASLLGAIGFMFSASLITWLPWSHTNSTILLPWLALTVYLWLEQRRRGALVGFAALLACALLGGSPEFFFIVAVVAALWALGLLMGEALRAWRGEASGRLSTRDNIMRVVQQAGWLAIAAAVGVLICAAQLLPFFEALGLSHISAIRPLGNVRAEIHLDAGMIVNWVLPRYWGQVSDGVFGTSQLPNETSGYIGFVALLGLIPATIGAVWRQINVRLVLPWAAIALFCWLVVYDDKVGTFLRGLPGFSQMVNERFLLGIGFALLVLGAFGWDWFSRWVQERGGRTTAEEQPSRRWTYVVGLALLAGGAAFMAAYMVGLVPPPNVGEPPGPHQYGVLYPPNTDYRLYWASWEAAVLVGLVGAVLLWATRPRWWRAVPLVMGALLVADSWMFLITYNGTAPAEQYYPQNEFISRLSAVPPNERMIAQGEVLLTHTNLVYGFRDWRAQDPMISERALRASTFLDPDYRKVQWTRYNMILSNIRLQVAPALGIRYFIFPDGVDPNRPAAADPGRPNFERIAGAKGLGLWEAKGVPGFVYLSDYVSAVPGEAEAAQWMTSLAWDNIKAGAALVEAPPDTVAGIARGSDGSTPGAVTVEEYTPGHIKLTVDAARQSLLVVAESYYPGWHATLDGAATPILRANYLSQGVVVPAGRHTVELRYEPDSFRNGALLSGAGLLGLLGLVVWARRRQRKAV